MGSVVPIARSQATDPGYLQQIGARINKAVKHYDDQRLQIAADLAEAKSVCKKAGIKFKSWVMRDVRLSYTEASRLAKIGASDDPAKALAELREKQNKRKREHDAKKKVALRNATFDTSRQNYIAALQSKTKRQRMDAIYKLLDDIDLSIMDFVKVLKLRK
jgi:hypothetical protein